jgi:hypothetical protein
VLRSGARRDQLHLGRRFRRLAPALDHEAGRAGADCEPARIFGDVFYREKDWQPLRAAGAGETSALRFRGYTLAGGYPEFHYEVGGREVYERLTPGEDGGLRRSFRVEAGVAPLSITLEPQAEATVTLRGLQRDGNIATFASRTAGEFTIEIHRRAVAAP